MTMTMREIDMIRQRTAREREALARTKPCRRCHSEPGQHCTTPSGHVTQAHAERERDAGADMTATQAMSGGFLG
jgi:hypothetical protein